MAIRPDNTLISNREMMIELAALPFRIISDALAALGTSHARMQALNAVAAIPEERLASKGLTRAEAISQTFRHDA